MEGRQRKGEKSNELESSGKMDRGAAIVIGFFVLNHERTNETETLVLPCKRLNTQIFVTCCNESGSLAKLRKRIERRKIYIAMKATREENIS